MKQILNHQLPVPTGIDKKRIFKYAHSLLKKMIMMWVTLFAFAGISFAQDTTPRNKTSEKHEMAEKLRTIQREKREEKQMLKDLENIPERTIDLFNTSFPKATNVSWTADGYYEVDFTLNNDNMMAFYDFGNNLIGTGKYVTYNSLPLIAQTYIAKRYKGYSPEKVMYYDNNEDNPATMAIFNTPVETDDYYALIKKGETEIVLQITTDGEVSYFSNFK